MSPERLALALLALPGAAAAQGARVLEIVAHDYAFQVPVSVPAGWTTVRLVNRGRQLHHVQINRLDEGHTLAEMLAAWRPGVRPPAWMSGVGGPTAAAGGQTLEGAVLLAPGRYAIICWVPAPDGQLHLAKGMMGQFEVVAAAANAAPPGAPDAELRLVDYAFTFTTPLRRGRQRVRVTNAGGQAHEVVVVRLAPGASAQDAAAWAERGQTGTAPGTMVGGVAGLSPGRSAEMTLDLAPGRYALICFMPDATDGRGRPHTHYGMLREIEVSGAGG